MKKLWIAAALTAAMTTSTVAQTTIRIGTAADHAPFSYLDAAGAPIGFEIDLGNAICARAGLSCEWVVTPWDTIIPDLIAGNFDLFISGMAITDERLALIDFSEPYYPPSVSNFAVRAGQAPDLGAPTGLRIGTQAGTVQAGFAETLAATNTVTTYATFADALAELAAGNLDVVVADRGFLIPAVAATNGAVVVAGPDLQLARGAAAGFRKEDDGLTATFDRILTEMKADGSLNALIVHWIEDPLTF